MVQMRNKPRECMSGKSRAMQSRLVLPVQCPFPQTLGLKHWTEDPMPARVWCLLPPDSAGSKQPCITMARTVGNEQQEAWAWGSREEGRAEWCSSVGTGSAAGRKGWAVRQWAGVSSPWIHCAGPSSWLETKTNTRDTGSCC